MARMLKDLPDQASFKSKVLNLAGGSSTAEESSSLRWVDLRAAIDGSVRAALSHSWGAVSCDQVPRDMHSPGLHHTGASKFRLLQVGLWVVADIRCSCQRVSNTNSLLQL